MQKHKNVQKSIDLWNDDIRNYIALMENNDNTYYHEIGSAYMKIHYAQKKLDKLVKPEDFTRVNSDSNGNPRYVLHFLKLIKPSDYNGSDIDNRYCLAVSRSYEFGGRRFHNKQYGGGIVFTCYNLDDLSEALNNFMEKE